MHHRKNTEQQQQKQLTMEEQKLLPPGTRFYPTEEELVSFYLHNKLEGKRQEMHRVIPVIDIHQREPSDLPRLAGELCQGDTEQWFFFTARQEREARGGRPVRTTASGYWKATGSPGYVYSSNNRVIGVKKTMVFYTGKVPTGRKTKWKMNEYKAIEEVPNSTTTAIPKLRHEFSLCRVYVVSGSSRAFDRRPQEAVRREAQPTGDMPSTSVQEPKMEEPTTSSETSHSWGGHDYRPRNGESATWEMINGPEPPLWGWEQQYWP